MSTLFDLPAEMTAKPRRAKAAELLEDLNDQQRRAVQHAGSPLLVVAGAGSGKTRVLTRRIAYLLAERDVHPGQIMAITFTNKAAAEMKERVAELVGRRANVMWVSTFHSMCVRVLRREATTLGMKSSFSVYDADDTRRLITLVSRDLDLDPKRYTVAEYFPIPGVSAFHDDRQHAVSLAFVVPVTGTCEPRQDALEVTWFSPEEAASDALAADLEGGRGTLIRQALAHLGLLR